METKLKFKGTPGPWRIKKIFDEDYVPPTFYEIRGANDKDSDFPRASLWGETETEEADARLIAAAPELLELCIKIRDFLGDGIFDGWDDDTVFLDAEVTGEMYQSLTNAVKKALEE